MGVRACPTSGTNPKALTAAVFSSVLPAAGGLPRAGLPGTRTLGLWAYGVSGAVRVLGQPSGRTESSGVVGFPSSPGETLTLRREELLLSASELALSWWPQSLSTSRLSTAATSSARPPLLPWLRSPMLMDLERARLLRRRSASRPTSEAPAGREKEVLPGMVPACGEPGTRTAWSALTGPRRHAEPRRASPRFEARPRSSSNFLPRSSSGPGRGGRRRSLGAGESPLAAAEARVAAWRSWLRARCPLGSLAAALGWEVTTVWSLARPTRCSEAWGIVGTVERGALWGEGLG